ncbi:MAG TPA: hypothetical protein VFE84_11295, partial [Patescibacteria group bacterium]|nr:hypothetical protein [Patescibacteria group bacterium]
MRFLYFYRVPLPDPRADAIQIINTTAGIARAGGDVVLHVETLGAGSTSECLDYYGVSLKQGERIGSVEIKAMGPHWSWPFFTWKTSVSALRAAGGTGGILFVRED